MIASESMVYISDYMVIVPIVIMNVGNIAPPEELAIVSVFVPFVMLMPDVGARTGVIVTAPAEDTLKIYIHLGLPEVAVTKNIPLELFESVIVALALLLI